MIHLCGNELKCLVTFCRDLCWGLYCPSTQKTPIQDTLQKVARKFLASHVGFSNQHVQDQRIMDVTDKRIQDVEGNPLASIVSAVDKDHREGPGEWEEAYGLVRESLKVKPTLDISSQKFPRSFWSVMYLSVLSLRKEAEQVLMLMPLCKGHYVPREVIHVLHQMTKCQLEGVTELWGRE